ncbi:MAG: 7-cyano-7-deazaguanine synthase QueC [Tepidisphaeraceae bacterium]
MGKHPAIVLLSGGLDSATTLAVAKNEGFALLYTLAFDYGQRHRQELAAAEKVSRAIGAAEHRVVTIDLRQFGHSALTDEIAVPKDRSEKEMGADIPVTYVPARNTIFLSFALAYAEVRAARDVFIGVNAIDFSGYPDCRPEYIAAFERMANLATKMTTTTGGEPFRVRAPLIHMTKAQIIRLGTQLNVDYSLTHSCYDPDATGRACGRCDSCVLRRRGFAETGVNDPTVYSV